MPDFCTLRNKFTNAGNLKKTSLIKLVICLAFLQYFRVKINERIEGLENIRLFFHTIISISIPVNNQFDEHSVYRGNLDHTLLGHYRTYLDFR